MKSIKGPVRTARAAINMNIIRLLSVLALCILSSAVSKADTTFVNLSDRPVRVARYYYVDGNGGDYNEQGWVFKGWTVIPGGDSWGSNSDMFYLEWRDNDRPITWPNLPKSKGFVRHGGPFEGFLARGMNENRLLDQDYKRVTFQTFADETYTISGNAYRIAEKNIPFSYESRSWKVLNEFFEVPGKLLEFNSDFEERGGRDINFEGTHRGVRLTGSIEGRQPYLGAPRTPGAIRGTIKVKYVAPR